jgi:hypothetical protein
LRRFSRYPHAPSHVEERLVGDLLELRNGERCAAQVLHRVRNATDRPMLELRHRQPTGRQILR